MSKGAQPSPSQLPLVDLAVNCQPLASSLTNLRVLGFLCPLKPHCLNKFQFLLTMNTWAQQSNLFLCAERHHPFLKHSLEFFFFLNKFVEAGLLTPCGLLSVSSCGRELLLNTENMQRKWISEMRVALFTETNFKMSLQHSQRDLLEDCWKDVEIFSSIHFWWGL